MVRALKKIETISVNDGILSKLLCRSPYVSNMSCPFDATPPVPEEPFSIWNMLSKNPIITALVATAVATIIATIQSQIRYYMSKFFSYDIVIKGPGDPMTNLQSYMSDNFKLSAVRFASLTELHQESTRSWWRESEFQGGDSMVKCPGNGLHSGNLPDGSSVTINLETKDGFHKSSSATLRVWSWNWRSLDEFAISLGRKSSDKYVTFYKFQRNGWSQTKKVLRTEMVPQHLVYPENLHEKLRDRVKAFYSPQTIEFERKEGERHKLIILLYGLMGTGKTTMIEYLAAKEGLDVYMADSTCFTSKSDVFSKIPPRSMFVVEEADNRFPPKKSKGKKTRGKRKRSSDSDDEGDEESSTSHGDMLQDFEGLSTPNGVVVVWTSNYPDQIAEQALSRADEAHEIPSLDHGDWRTIIKCKFLRYFPGKDSEANQFVDIMCAPLPPLERKEHKMTKSTDLPDKLRFYAISPRDARKIMRRLHQHSDGASNAVTEARKFVTETREESVQALCEFQSKLSAEETS
jgi:hypothetical protein